MWRSLFLFLSTASFAAAQIAPSAAPNAVGFSAVVTQETLPALVVQSSQQRAYPLLQPGDVILAADRRLVASPADLLKPEFCKSAGSLMRLDVYRPSQSSFFQDSLTSDGRCPNIEAYMRLVPRLVLKVSDVAPQSIAAQYGVQPGDTLLAAGQGLLVGTMQELNAKADELATQIATTPDFGLLFSRGGRVYAQRFHVAPPAASSSAVTAAQDTAPSASTPSPVQETPAMTQQAPATPAAAQPPANPVVIVQQILRSEQQSHSLAVTGTWNAATQENVSGFVQYLQKMTLAGRRWRGPSDGTYSDSYAAFLSQTIAAMKDDPRSNQTFAAQLETFMLAMNELKRSGVYQEAQGPAENSVPVASSGGKKDDGDFVFPAFLWFANGALSGFGDELWCGLLHGQQTFSACHAEARVQLDQLKASNQYVAVGANIAGVFINPISWLLIGVAVWSRDTFGKAAAKGLALGLLDFLLYTIGDVWTWGFHSIDFVEIGINALVSCLFVIFVIAKHRFGIEGLFHGGTYINHRHD